MTTIPKSAFIQRLLIALALYGLSLLLFALTGESLAVKGLWLLGMAWLLLSLSQPLRWPRLSADDGRDLLLLGIIVAAGWSLRYWHLGRLPDFFHGDIASQGLQALALLQGRETNWFSTGWSNIPMFDFVLMAATMRLWGADLFGLSMTAVWQGVLTLPLLYLLGREIGGRRVGLLAAAFLALNYTHIHFSRIVTTASPPLFLTAAFYVLFRSRRLHSLGGYALAGVLLGMGLLVYFPVRISIVIVILLFAWLLLWQASQVRREWQHWLSFAVGSLLGFGPMLAFALRDFAAFMGRGNVVTLANPQVVAHLQNKYGIDTMSALWGEQIKRTFLTFFSYGDASTHFGFPGPIVSVVVAVLMVVGLLLSLRRIRDERYWTLLVWWMGTLVLGGVITNDPPFWPHLVVVLPAVMLLAALGAVWLIDTILRWLPAAGGLWGRRALMAAVTVLLLWMGVHNWQAYVRTVGHNADTRVQIARYVADLPAGWQVRLLADPYHAQERELQFMGQQLRLSELNEEDLLSGGVNQPAVPTVFILTPNHQAAREWLQTRMPAGQLQEHTDAQGRPSFSTFTVVPAGVVEGPAQEHGPRVIVGWLLVALLAGTMIGAGVWIWRHGELPVAGEESAAIDQRPPHPAAPRPIQQVVAAEPVDRNWLGLLGVAAAVLLAYVGQHFYDADVSSSLLQAVQQALPQRLANDAVLSGSLFYGLAMLLFAAAAPSLATYVQSQRRRRRSPLRPRPDARIVRPEVITPTTRIDRAQVIAAGQWGWLAVALVPYIASMALFAWRGEDAIVRALWVLALAFFVGTQIVWPWWQQRSGRGISSPSWHWLHVLLLVLVLAGGFWLRFHRLAVLPHDFHGDMASHGLQAREILSGQSKNWFHEGWANIPMLAFMPAALSMKVFGNDIFGLRMASVIGGMVVLLALYLLVWRLSDRHRPAILATAILAVNTPHIHFSRIAEYMDPWPFLVLAMFLMVDGLKARRAASLAAAGVLLGLGVQMYYSGRVIIFILLVALLYLALLRREWLTENRRGLLLLVLGGLLAMGPSLIYFAAHRQALLERSRSVFLFYDPVMTHLKGKYGLSTQWDVLLEQIKRSLLMFNHSIDSSTQFGYPHPMFGSWLAPWVALGVAYAIRHWRRPVAGLSLIWLGNILVLGSILTNNAPFWPRLVGILPVAALLAGLAIDRTLLLLAPRGQRAHWVLAVLALLGIAMAGRANWMLYERTVSFNARGQARVGRYIETLPLDVAICNFSDPFALSVRETYFLASPRRIMDLPPDAPAGLIGRCPGPPLVWILTPNHMDRLPELQARWPDGRLQEHYYGNGVLAFSSYEVGGSIAAELQPPPAELPPTPPPSISTVPTASHAFMPDGSDFVPQQVFVGNTSSSPWQIAAGEIDVQGGEITLWVGPMDGHDAVYDYVRLRNTAGQSYLFEAEDPAVTSGDTYASREGNDNHWWLQNYEPFSNGQGLVAQKQELVPALKSTLQLPDGHYQVTIGSFTGDPNNGVFALGIAWQSP